MYRGYPTTSMHRGERRTGLGTPIFRGGYRGVVGAMFFLFFFPMFWYWGGYRGAPELALS
jgi:hypothetical protein